MWRPCGEGVTRDLGEFRLGFFDGSCHAANVTNRSENSTLSFPRWLVAQPLRFRGMETPAGCGRFDCNDVAGGLRGFRRRSTTACRTLPISQQRVVEDFGNVRVTFPKMGNDSIRNWDFLLRGKTRLVGCDCERRSSH